MNDQKSRIPLVNLNAFAQELQKLEPQPDEVVTSMTSSLKYRHDAYAVVEMDSQRAIFELPSHAVGTLLPEKLSLSSNIREFFVDHKVRVTGFLVKSFEINEDSTVKRQEQKQTLTIEYSQTYLESTYYDEQGKRCGTFEEPVLRMFIWGYELKRATKWDSFELASSVTSLETYDKTRIKDHETLSKVIYYIGFDTNNLGEIALKSFKVHTKCSKPDYHLKIEYNT